MTTTLEAIFESGVFRPTHPVELAEGTKVQVTVPQSSQPCDPREAARILADIAALAPQHAEPEFTSLDHDKILYGENGAR